jgi:uncharacterized protein (DUF952 family)
VRVVTEGVAGMGFIYHIALAADWTQARGVGEYTTSTRGVTLAQQGYIHAVESALPFDPRDPDRFRRG